MPTRRRRCVDALDATLVCGLPLLLIGCTGHLNTDDDLRSTDPSPALIVSPEGFGEREDGRSLRHGPDENGWDRRHWAPTIVSVPCGQTEAQPSSVGRIAVNNSLPRQRGDFPVDAEVLDAGGDRGDAALEGALNVAAAPGLLLVGPIMRWVADGVWPWTTVDEPPPPGGPLRWNRDYQRQPPPSPHTPWPWLGIDDEP